MVDQRDPHRLIAEVEFTKSPKPGENLRWTRLVPLYRAQDNRWTRVEDRYREYPTDGLVFWHDSPAGAETRGSGWVVQVGYEEEEPGRDCWKVTSGRSLIQLEDTGYDMVELRRLCASGQLTLDRPPRGEVLIGLPDDERYWVGPVDFRSRGSEPRPRGPKEVPTGFLDLFEIPPDETQLISMDRHTLRVPPPEFHDHRTRVGYWAAQSDQNLLRGLLRRITSMDGKLEEGLELTERVFESYLDQLDAAELLGPNEQRERARIQAAKELIREVKFDHDLLEETTEALLSHPKVERRLDEAVEERKRARIEEIEADLSSMESEKREELDQLDEELAGKLRELDEVKEMLAEEADRFQRQIEKTAHEILEDPLQSLARQEFLRAAIRSIRSLDNAQEERVVSWTPRGTACETLEDLLGAMKVGARALGLTERVALSSLSGLLAGRPLVISSHKDWDLIRLISSVLASGLAWVALVPTRIFGIDDLLNLPASPLGDSSTNSHRVGDLLQHSAEANEVCLIVLRGINRAPLEVAFEDLVASRESIDSNMAILWDAGDPSGIPRLLRVPRHILFAATFTDGPSCFGISKRMARDVAFLGIGEDDLPNKDEGLPVPAMHIGREKWGEFRTSTLETEHDRESSEILPLEARIYAGVFQDVISGFGEWCLSRRSMALMDSAHSMLKTFPSDVVDYIEAQRKNGVLEDIATHVEE